MIQIKNLTKSFDGKPVLEHLNCTIHHHCIYGLVGANGSGKSTLLRLINGILKQEDGEILVEKEFAFDNEKIKQKMVFVPDDLFFYPSYTISDMAHFYQALYPTFDQEYLRELVSKLKLNPEAKISSFSKGMKRQCALILALATRAKYFFFDETFDGLDPVVRNFFKKQLAKQMEEDDITIVMTSHNLRELEDVCDNLGLLYKGGILFESDISTIKTNMHKVQISFLEDFDQKKFPNFEILSFHKVGSVASMIIKDPENTAYQKLKKMKPIILDFLPLTLEEVFIYEMEALGYEFNEIL